MKKINIKIFLKRLCIDCEYGQYEDSLLVIFHCGIWLFKPIKFIFAFPIKTREETKTFNFQFSDGILTKTEYWKDGKKQNETKWEKIQTGETKCLN